MSVKMSGTMSGKMTGNFLLKCLENVWNNVWENIWKNVCKKVWKSVWKKSVLKRHRSVQDLNTKLTSNGTVVLEFLRNTFLTKYRVFHLTGPPPKSSKYGTGPPQ